jgi:5-bromo-4-chloroindolyl phosphate hydrolysis protein
VKWRTVFVSTRGVKKREFLNNQHTFLSFTHYNTGRSTLATATAAAAATTTLCSNITAIANFLHIKGRYPVQRNTYANVAENPKERQEAKKQNAKPRP